MKHQTQRLSPQAFARTIAALLSSLYLLQSGCAGSGSGLLIHDYSTGKPVAEVPMGNFRETIRQEAHPVGAFYTMTQENNQLIIRRRDSSGQEKSKMALPLLDTVWHDEHWCALDDSAAQFAYFDSNKKQLMLRRLAGGATRTIPSPAIDSSVSIRLFSWTGPNTLLLLVTRRDKNNEMEASSINVGPGNIHTQRIDLDWTTSPVLSPNLKWLAGVSNTGSLVVINASTFNRESVIALSKSGVRFVSPAWSADSQWLFYVMRNSKDKKSQLFRKCLSTNALEELPVPTNSDFYLQDSLGETISASYLGDADTNWILDLKLRSWQTLGRFNCEIFGIRGTTRYAIDR